jgi:hypothetical protein
MEENAKLPDPEEAMCEAALRFQSDFSKWVAQSRIGASDGLVHSTA